MKGKKKKGKAMKSNLVLILKIKKEQTYRNP